MTGIYPEILLEGRDYGVDCEGVTFAQVPCYERAERD